MGYVAYQHTDRALTEAEIRAAAPRWAHQRREIAYHRVQWLHARLSGATRRGNYDEADRWRAEVMAANDVYALFDRELQDAAGHGRSTHPVRPWLAIDNTAAHDRLERERSDARAAQTLTRGLTDAERRELAAREQAAIDALRALRIVREVRMHGVWTITLWILAPGEPRGYDATAVHDSALEIDPPEPRFTLAQAAAWAGELCRYRN